MNGLQTGDDHGARPPDDHIRLPLLAPWDLFNMNEDKRSNKGWLSGSEAARRLKVSVAGLGPFAERADIRRLLRPHLPTLFHEGDVDAYASQIRVEGRGIVPDADEAGAMAARAGSRA